MSIFSLDFRTCDAKQCVRCDNSNQREIDKTTGFCKRFYSERDGLPVRCVGDWAKEKIYYLTQYFGIFAMGMKNRFDELRYVEICSGPGRCCTRDGKEIDGTPLTVVNHPNFRYIKKAFFFDYSKEVVDVLNRRLRLDGKSDCAEAFIGDYNDSSSIVSRIGGAPKKTLTLCLVDPTNCSVPFATIKDVFQTSGCHCDFIISFFDLVDFNRNSVQAVLEPGASILNGKYTKFLGDADFFSRSDVVLAAKANNRELLRKLFLEASVDNLRKIGLGATDWVRIGGLYKLLYASSHPRGLDFWKKCSKYEPYGQGTFGF